jgi:hypothetical protein
MEIVRKVTKSGHHGDVVGTYVPECWIVCLDGEKVGKPCSTEEVALSDKAFYERKGHTVEIVYRPEKFSPVS